MIENCNMCNKPPKNNDSIFFDVSSSPDGKDNDLLRPNRIDETICSLCIQQWINDHGFMKINLIRRIGNPNVVN